MSTKSLDDLIVRVKNLLALAKSTHSVHEAEAANKVAQQLITKYQIESSRLNDSEIREEKIIFAGHRARISWKEKIITSVCHTNGCEVVIFGHSNPRQYGISYKGFGKKDNLEICKTIIDLILDNIEYLAKSDKSIKGKDGKDSFKTGCADRVSERLLEGRQSEIDFYILNENLTGDKVTALKKFHDDELVKSQEFMRKSLGSTQRLKSRSKELSISEYQKGREAGNQVSLSPRKGLKS